MIQRYSESLYAVLSIVGLYHLLSGANNVATLCFALSGAARSNGMLNAGYICFQTIHQAYNAIFQKKRASIALAVVASGAFRCFCVFIPFVSFQAYGYLNICRRHAEDERRPWCKGSGLLEIFPSETVAQLPTCIPNVVSCSLFNCILREAVTNGFLLSRFGNFSF